MLENILNHGYWEFELFGNLLRDYTLFIGVSVLLILAFYLIKSVLMGRLQKIVKKTSFDLDDTLFRAIDQINAYVYVLFSLFIGSRYLSLPEKFDLILQNLFLLVVVWQVIKFINVFVNYFVELGLEMKDDASSKTAILASKVLAEVLIWGLAIILLLDNFGVNVTSLVAGLGISGIAIALAVQNILSDLFSSFSIYFDKPFIIGDLIRYGTTVGKVEKIGLKTTRIRQINGVLVIVANKELTNAVVENLNRRDFRRVETTIGVDYNTPLPLLRRIPVILEEIVNSLEELEFVRAKLVLLNDSSIDFELIYNVQSSEYATFVENRQEVLYRILERFEKENISIPFPTQTMYNYQSS